MKRRTAKGVVASVLASDVVSPLARSLVRDRASIFTMHRFADPDRGNAGQTVSTLRHGLEYLRRNRYDLISLSELANRLASPVGQVRRSVAFTIDDGYADYASVAAPVFEAFDCPTTVFVVTGVLDNAAWYWWDRVRAAFERAERRTLTLELEGATGQLAWSPENAEAAAQSLVNILKAVSDADRRRVVDALPELLHAEIEPHPPAAYAPMTWDEVRRCGRGLTTFGPHTVTHPILARTDDEVARFEVTESWRRLRAETTAAIPIFCYPNGEMDDAKGREFALVRDAGMQMAVTTRPGYASRDEWHAGPDGRYSMPRFPWGEDSAAFIQVVNGVERVKMAFRTSVRRRALG